MDILSATGTILFSAAVQTIKELVVAAVKAGANLYSANLRGANLCGADLCGANLYSANLRGANLYSANLRGANLCGADLCGADLCGADLCGANLYGANLRGANLRGANLYGANLRGANLRGADLGGADLTELAVAQIQFIPEEGSFIGWKKCRYGVVVKLLIPAGAKRSHGTERKCRAEMVYVDEVIGAEVGLSLHDNKTEYRKGQIVKPDGFDNNRWNTCGQGIHFYLTRIEAENHA